MALRCLPRASSTGSSLRSWPRVRRPAGSSCPSCVLPAHLTVTRMGCGQAGGGPLPRDGARGHPRAAHPGRQALRPRAGAARTTGAFWVERRARGRGRSDHSRGDGHGVGVPPETAWRAAHHSRLCCRSQGRAGWGGAWGQRSRPRSPPRRHPGPAWPSIPSGEEAGRSRVAP